MEETNDFYDVLYKTLWQTNQNDSILFSGNVNARIGNNPIPDIMVPRGEQTILLYYYKQ